MIFIETRVFFHRILNNFGINIQIARDTVECQVTRSSSCRFDSLIRFLQFGFLHFPSSDLKLTSNSLSLIIYKQIVQRKHILTNLPVCFIFAERSGTWFPSTLQSGLGEEVCCIVRPCVNY